SWVRKPTGRGEVFGFLVRCRPLLCSRPADSPGSAALPRLAQRQSGDGATNDETLDLRGAFEDGEDRGVAVPAFHRVVPGIAVAAEQSDGVLGEDRKSTRLNSSHVKISYAV